VAAGCAFRGCPILRTSSRRHLRLKGDVNSWSMQPVHGVFLSGTRGCRRPGASRRAEQAALRDRGQRTSFLSLEGQAVLVRPIVRTGTVQCQGAGGGPCQKGPRHLPGRQRRGQTGAGGPCRAVQDTDSWCGAAAPSACPPSLTAVGARCGSGGPLGLGRLVLLRRLG